MTSLIKQDRTEAEAQALWCPWSIAIMTVNDDTGKPTVSAAGNRTAEGVPLPGSHCITTQCMAWKKFGDEDRGFCVRLALVDPETTR